MNKKSLSFIRRARLDIARRKSNLRDKEKRKKYKLYLLKNKDLLKQYILQERVYRENNIKVDLSTFNYNIVKYNLYLASYQVYNSYRKKRQRIKKGVITIIGMNPYSYFVTLTFENGKDCSLNAAYKKMSLISSYFIINEDFGSLYGRLHYHLIIGSDLPIKQFKTIVAQNWGYGYIDVKPIQINEKSIEKLTKYINKISNHAIKKTTTKCKYSESLRFINK